MARTIGRAIGLEVWAHGTWDEIAQLRAQLAAMGLIVVPEPDPTDTLATRTDPIPPHPIAGEPGRYRWYGRVRVRRA